MCKTLCASIRDTLFIIGRFKFMMKNFSEPETAIQSGTNASDKFIAMKQKTTAHESHWMDHCLNCFNLSIMKTIEWISLFLSMFEKKV